MRLYTLTHAILSPIQQGIQSSHAAAELVPKYHTFHDATVFPMIMDYLTNHKTVIALNGGMSSSLQEFEQWIAHDVDFYFPWVSFREDRETAENMLTSIAILVPTYVCDAIDLYRSFSRTATGNNPSCGMTGLSADEFELVQRLSRLSLAR